MNGPRLTQHTQIQIRASIKSTGKWRGTRRGITFEIWEQSHSVPTAGATATRIFRYRIKYAAPKGRGILEGQAPTLLDLDKDVDSRVRQIQQQETPGPLTLFPMN